MMIENLPHEKNQSIYFLTGLNGIQGENTWKGNEQKYLHWYVLTQNSLDAIFAQAKLLVPDWIFDLNSSSVKHVLLTESVLMCRGPRGGCGPGSQGSHHIIATNELLTGLGAGQPGCKSGPVLRNSQCLLCVGGQRLRAQGVKMVLFWVKH